MYRLSCSVITIFFQNTTNTVFPVCNIKLFLGQKNVDSFLSCREQALKVNKEICQYKGGLVNKLLTKEVKKFISNRMHGGKHCRLSASVCTITSLKCRDAYRGINLYIHIYNFRTEVYDEGDFQVFHLHG